MLVHVVYPFGPFLQVMMRMIKELATRGTEGGHDYLMKNQESINPHTEHKKQRNV